MFFFCFEGMTWFGNPVDFPNQVVENCLFLLGWGAFRHLLVPVPHLAPPGNRVSFFHSALAMGRKGRHHSFSLEI